jgi:hypothetical protein
MTAKFYLVEASKVGRQHITLLDGYVRALKAADLGAIGYEFIFAAHEGTFESLPLDSRNGLAYLKIHVMDPERRRLVRKSLLEAATVLRLLLKARSNDIILVTCLLPPALILLEFANRLLRRRNLHVVLHGEVEGLYDRSLRKPSSFGYWIWKWLCWRSKHSRIGLVVIDDFIRDRLLKDFTGKIEPRQVQVLHHPIIPPEERADLSPTPRACFIGYRTPFKGFPDFQTLKDVCAGTDLLAIGGGVVEDLRTGQHQTLNGTSGYLKAISGCDVAVFPYRGGYDTSLSAAALDALATGVHMIATRRPCFQALASYFGPGCITLYEERTQLGQLIGDPDRLRALSSARSERLAGLSGSKYGLAAVKDAFLRFIAACQAKD